MIDPRPLPDQVEDVLVLVKDLETLLDRGLLENGIIRRAVLMQAMSIVCDDMPGFLSAIHERVKAEAAAA